jgi:hypothetical protein
VCAAPESRSTLLASKSETRCKVPEGSLKTLQTFQAAAREGSFVDKGRTVRLSTDRCPRECYTLMCIQAVWRDLTKS